MGRRTLIGQRGGGDGGRRTWQGCRGSDEGGRSAGFAVIALEKVVHTLATHDGFEGQGALQSLQLKDKQENKKGKYEVKLQPVTRYMCFCFRGIRIY